MFSEEILHRIATQVEVCLDDAAVGSALDGFRVSPLSKQEGDSAEDDALSCTCLTCNDRESRLESHIQRINECEVLDVQLLDHEV